MRQDGVPSEAPQPAPARGPAAGWARTVGLLLLLWVILAAVVVGVGWLLSDHEPGLLRDVDLWVSRWLAGHRTSALTTVARIAQVPGNTITGQVVLLVLAAGFSVWRRSLVPLLFVALVDVGLVAIYLGAGYLDPRLRPPVRILDSGLVPDHSFPSGHVATAVSVCGSALVLTRRYAAAAARWAAPLLVIPLCTLLARLYEGAHYLTDVLTTLGYATVWLLVVSTAFGWTATPTARDAGGTARRRSRRAAGPVPAPGRPGPAGRWALDP